MDDGNIGSAYFSIACAELISTQHAAFQGVDWDTCRHQSLLMPQMTYAQKDPTDVACVTTNSEYHS